MLNASEESAFIFQITLVKIKCQNMGEITFQSVKLSFNIMVQTLIFTITSLNKHIKYQVKDTFVVLAFSCKCWLCYIKRTMSYWYFFFFFVSI